MAKTGTAYIVTETTTISFEEAVTIASETHTFTNEIANQTLEDGSNLADHIIVQQDELECQLFVSNAVPGKSQEIYAQLKNIRNNREMCTVYTEHQNYERMVIESVNAPHEAPMVNQIVFTVKFKQIDWGFEKSGKYKDYYTIPVKQVQSPQIPKFPFSSDMVFYEDFANQNRMNVEQTASSISDVGHRTAAKA